MSGFEGARAARPPSEPPLAPRSSICFEKSSALNRGGSYPAPTLRCSCASIFLCSLKPSAAPAFVSGSGLTTLPCSQSRSATGTSACLHSPAGLRLGAGPLSRVVSQNALVSGILRVLRHDTEGGPARREGGGSACRSHSTQIAQQNHTARKREVLRRQVEVPGGTSALRAGGGFGEGTRSALPDPRHVYLFSLLIFF